MTLRPVLAVFGGSFDPPHVAHVLLPALLFTRGLADRVLVAPCFEHALGKDLTPFATRRRWVHGAMAQYDPRRVLVSDIERDLALQTRRPSYSFELLQAVAVRHPQAHVRLVVGSDIIESGETERWHRWEDIAREFTPIVVPRAGWSDGPALPEVSSTQVRAWLAEDDVSVSARLAASVPRAVLEMIASPPSAHVWIVGSGHVATHASARLHARVPGVTSEVLGARALVERGRPEHAAEPDGVWVLTRDGHIGAVASSLAKVLRAPVPVLHGAGALVAAEALAPLPGWPVGTLHPICSVRRERAGSRLATALFGFEGEPAARRLAQVMVGAESLLDLQGLDATARRAYHGACALVANHLAVLVEAAGDELATVIPGEPRARLRHALMELLLSSADNLAVLGIPDGITGPLSRGNHEAVQQHLDALGSPARDWYERLSTELARLLDPR